MSALLGYNEGSWGTGQWLVMGMMMLLVSGLALGLGFWALRGYRGGSQSSQTKDGTATSPDSVLAGRYARGEIEEDEYLRRRELLGSAPVSPSGGKRNS
jgi:putative membrane protein